MKNIVILGSTGSIGKQALDVVRANRDKFKVVGLAGGENVEALLQQVKEFSPIYVNSPNIKEKSWNNAKVVSLEEMAVVPEADLVLISTVGSVGLVPTLEAIRSKKEVALANKEVLIMAGELVMAEAKKYNVQILPVDSEHNAVWQCLMGDCTFGSGSVSGPVKRIIITASGGAFRDWPVEKLDSVTPEEALAHPTWSMGKKITIDSATLMNKGFEVIEARWLFGMDYESYKNSGDEKYFFYPSRISPNKRQDYAITAFEKFKRRKKGYKLVISGALSKDLLFQSYYEKIKRMAEKTRDVKILINVSEEMQKELFSKATAVLYPPINEDYGLVPLEAMASSKPVIAVNEGGPKDTIINNKTGFLVNNTEEMADKMLFIAEHKSIASDIGKEGLKRVKKYYSWKKFFETFDEKVRKIAKS